MQQQLRLTEQERADLVAFIDGELDEEDAQKLEAKVAASVSARKEVGALAKTWSMLDWLPRMEAPEDFASQTVTRIHSQQLRAERIEGRLKQVAGLLVKLAGCAVSLAAALALGYFGLRYAWPDPTRDLIEDLEIVQNLETFQAIPDIKFLDDLSRLPVFAEPGTAGEQPPESAAPPEQPRGAAAPNQPM